MHDFTKNFLNVRRRFGIYVICFFKTHGIVFVFVQSLHISATCLKQMDLMVCYSLRPKIIVFRVFFTYFKERKILSNLNVFTNFFLQTRTYYY